MVFRSSGGDVGEPGRARPKTANIWSRSSSVISLARPSVSAGRPPSGRGEGLTPRNTRPTAYEGPARNVSNHKNDFTANSQIARDSMVRLGDPGTPEMSTQIPRKSRNKMLKAAYRQTPDGEYEIGLRAPSSAYSFSRDGSPGRPPSTEDSHRAQEFAAQRLANDLTAKNIELTQERDRYRRLYEDALKQMEILKTQLSRSETGSQMLQREDISVEKFFELAARQSLEEPRKGFLTMGNQFLRGGSAMQGTVQLTLNGLGTPPSGKSRPHTAGTVKFGHASSRPSTANQRQESENPAVSPSVPQPRFWGTGIVEDYTLDGLRQALREVGSKGEDHFPRTARELDGRAARAELMDERKHHQQVWARGIAMLSEMFGHELDPHALPDEVVRVFEEKLPRRLHGETCIIYFLHPKSNEISCTSKTSKRQLRFPLATGIAGQVQEQRRTLVATNLMQAEKEGWKEFCIQLEADRVSAIASPCYDDHKRMLAVIEVSRAETIQFTRTDRRLLELACVLFVEVMNRTKVAAEHAHATNAMNTTIDCLQDLARPNIVEQINLIAERCRGLIRAERSRVWLVNRKLQELFVNAEDESQVESCAIGVGHVGSTYYNRMTEAKVIDGVSVMLGPIVDRNSEVLGVLELTGREPPTSAEWPSSQDHARPFDKRDENVTVAYCAILANYVEHSQYVQMMRSTLGSIRSAGDEALEAIQASTSIRDGIREMFKESSPALRASSPGPGLGRRSSFSPAGRRSSMSPMGRRLTSRNLMGEPEIGRSSRS